MSLLTELKFLGAWFYKYVGPNGPRESPRLLIGRERLMVVRPDFAVGIRLPKLNSKFHINRR
jgi:hypothetical protein